MNGLVGYDQVLPVLRQLGVASDSEAWFSCRSHFYAEPHPNVAGQPILNEWLADDCPSRKGTGYAAFFRELDAWTEYWDIYHPETRGRFYFGAEGAPGYLSAFLPNARNFRNPVFDAWKRLALYSGDEPDPGLLARFRQEATRPHVSEAALAVEKLVCGLVKQHFGTSQGGVDRDAYLDAMERFGKNTLPPCPERFNRIPGDDPRKSSSFHHTIEGHVMWFGWAVHLECAQLAAPADPDTAALRQLLMAGAALGCSFDFAYRGRCRTRKEYTPVGPTAWRHIWSRANECAPDFSRGSRELRQLFRIREYGDNSG